MKIKTNAVLIVVALLAYWVGLCHASAFYDPGAQRWLNRDPVGERGGIDLFCFNLNQPISKVDALGHGCMDYLCARAAANDVQKKLKESGIKDRDDVGGGNAFLHCVIGCQLTRTCGKSAQKTWDDRENPSNPTPSNQQDLNNNHNGYGVADQPGSCWDNCMKLWDKGELSCEGGTKKCPPPANHPPEPKPPTYPTGGW